MAIQIHRGILGTLSPLIIFTGKTSDNISAVNGANRIGSISVQYNIDDADYVDIVDNHATSGNGGHTTFELLKVHYSEWEDGDGNSFGSATNVVQYIEQQVVQSQNRIALSQANPHTLTGIAETVNASVGVAFTYNANYYNGISYFWDEASFPAGVEVSRYDQRRISGIVTQTGTYDIEFQVTGHNGTSLTKVIVDVT
jgi:hypothetical protein